jgi:hypothetical protein
MKKPDVAQKVQEVYKDLVNSIPSNQFGESDTKEKCCRDTIGQRRVVRWDY